MELRYLASGTSVAILLFLADSASLFGFVWGRFLLLLGGNLV